MQRGSVERRTDAMTMDGVDAEVRRRGDRRSSAAPPFSTILDTNVLVSGPLSPYGAPAEVVCLAVWGTVTLCVDARILIEYEQVLARPKFAFGLDTVEAVLDVTDISMTMRDAKMSV